MDDQQQLHHGGVHVRAVAIATRGLDDEDVVTTDRLEHLHDRLAVGECADAAGRDRDIEVATDILGELRVGVAVHDAERAVAAVARLHCVAACVEAGGSGGGGGREEEWEVA